MIHCCPKTAAKGTCWRLRKEQCIWSIQSCKWINICKRDLLKQRKKERKPHTQKRNNPEKKQQSAMKDTISPERPAAMFEISSSWREKWALQPISKCFMGSVGHSHTCSARSGKLADWNHSPRKMLDIANSSWNEVFCTCYFLFMFEIIF